RHARRAATILRRRHRDRTDAASPLPPAASSDRRVSALGLRDDGPRTRRARSHNTLTASPAPRPPVLESQLEALIALTKSPGTHLKCLGLLVLAGDHVSNRNRNLAAGGTSKIVRRPTARFGDRRGLLGSTTRGKCPEAALA